MRFDRCLLLCSLPLVVASTEGCGTSDAGGDSQGTGASAASGGASAAGHAQAGASGAVAGHGQAGIAGHAGAAGQGGGSAGQGQGQGGAAGKAGQGQGQGGAAGKAGQGGGGAGAPGAGAGGVGPGGAGLGGAGSGGKSVGGSGGKQAGGAGSGGAGPGGAGGGGSAGNQAGAGAAGAGAAGAGGAGGNPPTDCVPSGVGTDYPVGPGTAYTHLTDVPWEALDAGDTVRIYWQGAAYKEKFVINRSGTSSKPIRVCGVPGPSGERPVIDGNGATTRAGQTYRSTGEGASIDMENYALILVDGVDYGGQRPEYIVLDGLDIRGGNSQNGFTSTGGKARTYVEGSACIRIQKGAHIVLRNNEISDCDNGVFSQTQEDWDDATQTPHEPTITRDILLDGNYLHGHGVATGGSTDRYHNSYIQSVGAVYQYNHYGPQRPGANGSALKDRSIGTVVRFNRIEGCARATDLVEAENNPHMALLDPAYRQTFVYGNLIAHEASDGVAIHYGGDHYGGDLFTLQSLPWPSSAYGESFFRKGTLYFFANTVVLGAAGEYGSSIFQISTTEETAEIFDNVFWTSGSPMFVGLRSNTGGINLAHWTPGGTIHLGVNVFNTGWASDSDPDHTSPGPVTGAANMLTTSTPPVDLTTLHLVAGAVGIDAATPPSSFPALASYPDDREYTDDLHGKARVQQGAGVDLGAVEGF